MANLKKKTEEVYVLTMSEAEFDVLAGVVLDLADNRVVMDYRDDGDSVVPTKKGLKILKKLSKAVFSEASHGPDYDYFDYWKSVDKT